MSAVPGFVRLLAGTLPVAGVVLGGLLPSADPCQETIGAHAAGVELVFAPRPQTTLAKRFDFESHLALEECTVNGREFGFGGWRVQLASSLRLTDEYEVVADGAPRDFVRRFGSASGKWWWNDHPTDILGFFGLLGVEVRFTWDTERGEFRRGVIGAAFPGCDLACLPEDMELRGLLPPEAPVVGDRWVASGRGVVDALWASTAAGLCAAPEASEDERLVQRVLLPPLSTLAGEKLRVDCRFLGTAPDQDVAIQRIGLAIEDRIEVDLTELANEYVLQSTWWHGPAPVKRLVAHWNLHGKGTLDWDTAGRHFSEFGLALDVRLEIRCELDFTGREFDIAMLWEGESSWASLAERIEPEVSVRASR